MPQRSLYLIAAFGCGCVTCRSTTAALTGGAKATLAATLSAALAVPSASPVSSEEEEEPVVKPSHLRRRTRIQVEEDEEEPQEEEEGDAEPPPGREGSDADLSQSEESDEESDKPSGTPILAHRGTIASRFDRRLCSTTGRKRRVAKAAKDSDSGAGGIAADAHEEVAALHVDIKMRAKQGSANAASDEVPSDRSVIAQLHFILRVSLLAACLSDHST